MLLSAPGGMVPCETPQRQAGQHPARHNHCVPEEAAMRLDPRLCRAERARFECENGYEYENE